MSFSSSSGKQDITSTIELPAMSEPVLAGSGGVATTTALGIDELTLLILEKVPTEHLSKLRRVSKKWNQIISSVGYCVKPISLRSLDEFTWVVNDGPHYALDVTIGINPAINNSTKASSLSYNIVVALESVNTPAELLSKAQEFITSPPITTIMLGLADPTSPLLDVENHVATEWLRDDTGIRLNDVLEGFEELRAEALRRFQLGGNLDGSEPLQPVAFFRYAKPAVVTYRQKTYDGEHNKED